MLLIIFMVLIFNSLSSLKMKKQQCTYYLWQAAKKKKKIMQRLHSFFSSDSIIVQDKQQSPRSHPHPSLMWKRWGQVAETLQRQWFLKKKKNRHLILALAFIRPFTFYKDSRWDKLSRLRICLGVGFKSPQISLSCL